MTENPVLGESDSSSPRSETPISPEWPTPLPDSDQTEPDNQSPFGAHTSTDSTQSASVTKELAFDFLRRQQHHDDVLSDLANEVQGHDSEIEAIRKRNEEFSEAIEGINNLEESVGSLERRVTTTEDILEDMQHSSLIGAISDTILEYPQTALYPISLVILMTALFYSNPLLALFGGLLLIMTILHYGAGSN